MPISLWAGRKGGPRRQARGAITINLAVFLRPFFHPPKKRSEKEGPIYIPIVLPLPVLPLIREFFSIFGESHYSLVPISFVGSFLPIFCHDLVVVVRPSCTRGFPNFWPEFRKSLKFYEKTHFFVGESRSPSPFPFY